MSIILFILILALLVLVHEFGHFIAAKKSGVKVEEFGFGFPPRLFGIKKGETLYSVNAIPLGGFVKLYGEELHESAKDKDRAFIYKKPWQKTVIIVAGILGNFILGWILFSYLFTQGVPVPSDKVIVDRVQPGSPAHRSGLIAEDKILKIIRNNNEYSIKTSDDLINFSKKFAGEKLSIEVIRDNKTKRFTLTPRKNPPKNQGPLGIVITSFDERKYSWYEAPYHALLYSTNLVKQIGIGLLKIIGQFITFQKPSADVAGPIGIASMTGKLIKFGTNAVIEFIALLSLNLAVINIFPFPALDGGRLMFVIYEWVTRKRVNRTVEKYTNLIGILILLSLALLVSINDIIKLYR